MKTEAEIRERMEQLMDMCMQTQDDLAAAISHGVGFAERSAKAEWVRLRDEWLDFAWVLDDDNTSDFHLAYQTYKKKHHGGKVNEI